MPRDPVVRVTESEARAGQADGPTVMATLVNEGPEIEVRYWVLTPGSDERLCQGTLKMGALETRAVSFTCPELGDPTAPFTVLTGPAG